MAFEVEFQDSEVKKMLEDLTRHVQDFKLKRKGIVSLMSAVVFSDVMDHFSKEQGSESKWKEWSYLYDRAMARRGRSGNKILQDSGQLRQHFKPGSNRLVNEGILWYNNAKTKSGAPYAYYHNDGIGKMPTRDFMWLSDKAISKLEVELLQYLMEGEK